MNWAATGREEQLDTKKKQSAYPKVFRILASWDTGYQKSVVQAEGFAKRTLDYLLPDVLGGGGCVGRAMRAFVRAAEGNAKPASATIESPGSPPLLLARST
jgi:hypothetical protein